MVNRFRCFLAVFAVVVLASGCMSSGEPVSWEDQADETGEGLVEREFTAACLAANDDLPTVRAKDFCGCVLGRVQAAVTFEEFKGLDDFIDKHRDDVTVAMLGEHYGWFVEATEACGA
ncbi:MAG: hypothetical protein VYA92_03970 [Actinomycetota bacterium]|nr:hypothetical protein [Actinomycetota bacterium]MEC8873149.1 hypothetical protein [Actinomycetota bacterium]MEC9424503.1 hypothetical protein [Actinomycetota bacterium]MEC9426381.1 hypothetical protein [Actinomycetota bacterium]MEC9450663.1 hypothetical protein [Actinomycetota bacterium]